MSCDIANKDYVSGTEEYIDFDNVNIALDDHYKFKNYGVQTVWSIITFQIWYKKFMKDLN